MKKIVVLLICVLLVAALAIPALAADEASITITPDRTSAAAGDTITFTVTANSINGVRSIGVVPTFDSKYFVLENGTCNVPGAMLSNFTEGKGLVAVAAAPLNIEGKIGTFTVKVVSECPVDAAAITAKVSVDSKSLPANTASIAITGEHSFGAWAPNGDNHVHTCSKCGAEETGEHSMVKGEVTQQPNCTTEGKQNATCSDCGLSTSVSVPTNDNHSWDAGKVTTEPKCGVEGVKTYTCQHNAAHTKTEVIPALEHVLPEEWSLVVYPTCTKEGMEQRCCELCWNPVLGTGYRVTRSVPAAGHTYGEWYVATEATCEEPGEKHRDCTRVTPGFDCDHYESEVIPATGHTYDKVEVTAPTCTEQGFTTHTCTACGDSYVDTYTNPTGHKMGEWYVDVPATCEATGTDRRDCANCEHSETRTTKALGHDYKSEVTTPATCKDEGVLTYTCQNDKSHTYTESIPKTTTHTPSDETVEIKAPTCTEQGISSGKCAICGVNMNEFKTDALGHDMGDWYVKTDSTCTATGEERSDCSRCDHSETKVIEKKEHTYESVVTAPTCTKNGYTTHTCSVCGNSYETPGDKALGHEYTSKVTTEPGCETEGVKTFTCVRGDHSYTETIPATGHSTANMEVTKEPTCEEDGLMSGKCPVCHKELSNEKIPALGHDYELDKEVAPTCDEKGHKTYVCKNDATHTKTEEIDALGHTYGDWIKVDAENHKHVCACGHEETVAHKWDTGKVTVEPTHTETGIKTFECKDCRATREEVVDKTTKHEYTDKAEQIVDEEGKVDTKYHTGFCACGEEHKEEHSFAFIKIVEEATEGKKGKKLYGCECGYTEEIGYSVDGTLDKEPGMGDITGQVVMTGIAAFSMIAAAAYVFIRKRTA